MFRRPGVTNGAIGSVPYMRELIQAAYPEAKFNEDIRHRMTEDEIIAFLADCDCAIMGGDVVNDRVLEALPHIRTIGIFGVGLNTVDLTACQRHGVRLGFTPGVNRGRGGACAVLHDRGAPLGHAAQPCDAQRRATAPRRPQPDRAHGRPAWLRPYRQEVVRLLRPFGCTVITHDIETIRSSTPRTASPGRLDELLERSEVLSLHIPRGRATENLYDTATLAPAAGLRAGQYLPWWHRQ